MLVLDVNVVVAAHRADHPHHAIVRPWFDSLVGEERDFGVPDLVWASFLRLTTNRRIFTEPTPLDDAFAFIDATIGQPSYLTVGPGRRHLALVRQLCEEADALGDLVPDAVLGAIALEHGATVASLDRDFARFPSVRHIRPSI
ncbi:type II toxin-antitoxin system VapC family toxin [soil metagenome]